MRKFILIFGLLLMAGIVAAHDVSYKEKFAESKHFERDNVVVSRTVFAYYDNDDRASTYDYRHGYSYRTTRDYFNDKHFDKHFDRDFRIVLKSRDYDYRDYHYFDHGRKGYHYDYVPHLRSYDRRDCYVRPPADKLFYIKC